MPPALVPADILLWKRRRPIDAAIRFIQSRRPSLRPYREFTHCGVVVSASGSLVEAVVPQVRRRILTPRDHDGLTIVHLTMTDRQRAAIVSAACGYVGTEYGIADVLNFGVMLAFGRQCPYRDRDSVWCSQLCADALAAGGLLTHLDPWQTSPASLAHALGVTPT